MKAFINTLTITIILIMSMSACSNPVALEDTCTEMQYYHTGDSTMHVLVGKEVEVPCRPEAKDTPLLR